MILNLIKYKILFKHRTRMNSVWSFFFSYFVPSSASGVYCVVKHLPLSKGISQLATSTMVCAYMSAIDNNHLWETFKWKSNSLLLLLLLSIHALKQHISDCVEIPFEKYIQHAHAFSSKFHSMEYSIIGNTAFQYLKL